MSGRLIVSLSLVMVVFTISPLTAEDTETKTEATSKSIAGWEQNGWPLMQQFCLDCHNQDTQEGELDLTGFQKLDSSNEVGNSMQRVLEMVRFGAMPPEDADLPDADQRKRLVSALDQALFAVSCDLRPRPGKVTARRLNRSEYNNSIRDLFGMDLRPADLFPSDEVGAGFDNNADVLSISPMLIEKYLDAAEFISEQVLIDPSTLPRLRKDFASDQLLIEGPTKTGRFNGRFLATESFAWVDVDVPVAGEYRIRVRGGTSQKNKDATMMAIFDGDGVLRGTHEFGYYGGSGDSEGFAEALTLKPGSHRFFFAPIEDSQRESRVGKTRSDLFANLNEEIVKAAKQRREKPLKPDIDLDGGQFPFMLRSVSVEGPREHSKDLYPPSQFQILRRMAKHDRGRWRDVEKAAAECLKPLMRRAFRQPIDDKDLQPYVALVKTATDDGETYYRGLQIAISAVLTSPRFLFRVETPAGDWKPSDDEPDPKLNQHQLATRLAYFLWSSTPDERLLDDADKGRLKGDKVQHHVRRMIADPKAEALASEFASQWLGIRNLAVHEADTEHFKDFEPQLTKSMARETQLLFLHLLRHNRPIAELLTADYTFLNTGLARHYGMDHQSDEFQKVSLSSTNRRGILSHASILTFTSNPNRTSPVKRGKWILENVLGTPPPEPPPGVPELEETKTAGNNATFREQMDLHRSNPTCASCHRVMDELGFGLQQYDAIGRYREKEAGRPVNARGVLPDGREFNGAAELSSLLADSEREAFARTTVTKLLTFAIGRELTPSDRCTIDEIVENTAKDDYRIIDLILAVVDSRPFRYYEWAQVE